MRDERLAVGRSEKLDLPDGAVSMPKRASRFSMDLRSFLSVLETVDRLVVTLGASRAYGKSIEARGAERISASTQGSYYSSVQVTSLRLLIGPVA